MYNMCEMCGSGPKNTYNNGFKRNRVVCDKGVGKLTLSLFNPSYLDRMVCGFTLDPSCGYILLETPNGSSFYYCSLKCLNFKCPIENLTKGMSDYDKYDILSQLEKEIANIHIQSRHIYKKRTLELEYGTFPSKDPLETIKKENTLLKYKLDEVESTHKEIIQNILCDEDKLKESIERKKQKEIDKLTDALKERDKRLFQLQCRMIEMEGKELI